LKKNHIQLKKENHIHPIYYHQQDLYLYMRNEYCGHDADSDDEYAKDNDGDEAENDDDENTNDDEKLPQSPSYT